jgi:hypothetical protein
MTHEAARHLFAAERAAFRRAFPNMPPVQLTIRARHFLPTTKRTPRDLAWYDADRQTLCLMRSALTRSRATIQGIVRHELGHAADERIDLPGSERRADALALRATGTPILYDDEGLQNSKRGNPVRPEWLHR